MNRDPEQRDRPEQGYAGDVDAWTEEPGDPDAAGPAAEFVDEPAGATARPDDQRHSQRPQEVDGA